jgi:hypothetical protein
MPTDTFRAGVTYGDWTGTAAADNADQNDLRDLLAAKKVFDREKEFLLGASLWIGENHGGKVQAPFVSAIITPLDNAYDNLELKLEALQGPIPVRRVEVELTLDEFVGLFKRFAVVLTTRGLDLEDREYEWDQNQE